jgi:hypothetical protein
VTEGEAPAGPPRDGFTQLLSRRLNDEQRAHLYQLRDALGIANNDALWKVLVVLEEYDGLFKSYPEKLATAASSVFAAQKAALAATVAAETSHVRRSLENALVKTVKETAGRQADAARWRAWAWVAAALTLFAGICVVAGGAVAQGAAAWPAGGSASAAARLLFAILRAPTGWTIFAFLVPLAVVYGRQGWSAIRDRGAARSERITGAAILSGAVAGAVACAVVLLRVLGVS